MPACAPALAGFEPYRFQHDGIEHAVYQGGRAGDPALLLMCELSGFAPGLLAMAERLIEAGYQVHLRPNGAAQVSLGQRPR